MKKLPKTIRKNLYGFFLECSALLLLATLLHPLFNWLMEGGYH